MEKFLYPVTPETMHEYAEKVFAPIRVGQCVTVEFYPHAGKRTWNKFLINHLSLFKKELPDQKKFLLFYLDPIELTALGVKPSSIKTIGGEGYVFSQQL